jgi:hypothetical protein
VAVLSIRTMSHSLWITPPTHRPASICATREVDDERNDRSGNDLASKDAWNFGSRRCVWHGNASRAVHSIRCRGSNAWRGAASGPARRWRSTESGAAHRSHQAASGATQSSHGAGRGAAGRAQEAAYGAALRHRDKHQRNRHSKHRHHRPSAGAAMRCFADALPSSGT